MKQIVKMVAVLTILGVISGLVLSLVSEYAQPIIEANEQEAIEEAIYYVLPRTKDYETKTYNGKKIYSTVNEEGSLVGYAFTASGSGYQGTIKLMVGVDSNLEQIQGIQILESEETPGLGGKIRGEEFKTQFRGLNLRPEPDKNLALVKTAPTSPGEVQAITGATISSRTVVDTINKVLQEVRSYLQVD